MAQSHRSARKQRILGTMSAETLITMVSMGIGAQEELKRRGWNESTINEQAVRMKIAAEKREANRGTDTGK